MEPDWWTDTRRANVARLNADGFKVSRGLPIEHEGDLRPVREVAARIMALKALFMRTLADTELLSEDRVNAYVARNNLRQALTEDEIGILETDRDEVADLYQSTIGWRLENMWALAWVIGYETDLTYLHGMIDLDVMDPILLDFLPTYDEGSLDVFANAITMRPEAEIRQMEDLFFCAHNAIRSAQLGHDTVPKGFDAFGHGGCIHERRHALTWVLSEGVAWDDTDLST